MKTETDKLRRVTELMESAILDFAKLFPFIGDAAAATAKLYRDDLDEALRDSPPTHPPAIGEICMCPERTAGVLVIDPVYGQYYECAVCHRPFQPLMRTRE